MWGGEDSCPPQDLPSKALELPTARLKDHIGLWSGARLFRYIKKQRKKYINRLRIIAVIPGDEKIGAFLWDESITHLWIKMTLRNGRK